MSHEELHRRIAERAYFRFARRGGVHGHDVEDWFHAEAEILKEISKKSSASGTAKEPEPAMKRTSTKKSSAASDTPAAKSSTAKRKKAG